MTDTVLKPQMPYGALTGYEDGKFIRAATQKEAEESAAYAKLDGGAGVIKVDGVRCYVQNVVDNVVPMCSAPNLDLKAVESAGYALTQRYIYLQADNVTHSSLTKILETVLYLCSFPTPLLPEYANGEEIWPPVRDLWNSAFHQGVMRAVAEARERL